MKILVLFTGGTIGSTVDGATVHTDPAAASRLLSLYRARFGEDVLFEVRRPCNLLSENATPGLWSLLERSVREEELAVYDGVIITHGSIRCPIPVPHSLSCCGCADSIGAGRKQLFPLG